MRYIKSYTNDAAIQAAVDDKFLGKPYVALDENTGLIDWNSYPPDYSKMYLTIEALENGNFYVRNADVSYSVNGGAWETTTGETALALNQGDTVRFKGTTGGRGLLSGNTLTFNAYGNIESLTHGDNFYNVSTAGNYKNLFVQSNVISAKNLILPAATLTGSCYDHMFQGCINLTSAPELPATTLAEGCYYYMFYACTSLTNAPELPATTLESNCYYFMFYASSNLSYVKCLATDKSPSAYNCTYKWLNDVASTGTFVKAAGATWPTGKSGIPSGWTVIEE